MMENRKDSKLTIPAQKKLFWRRSAPALFAKGKVLASLSGSATDSTSRNAETFDESLTYDVSTTQIFRHPVAGSDGRIHEAASLLGYMGMGGRSPFTRAVFTSAVYLLPLKNDLDKRYGENESRHDDYEMAPIMEAIQGWIKIYNDKHDPIDLAEQFEATQYLPEDSDDEAPVRQAAADDAEPHHNSFLSAFLTWRHTERLCCLPPVSFWSRKLDKPAINAAVNTFLVVETFIFLFGLISQENTKSVSTAYWLYKALTSHIEISVGSAFIGGFIGFANSGSGAQTVLRSG